MRKSYIITSPEQFDTIHFVQGDTLKYKCLNCGKECNIARYDRRDLDRYKRMLCRRCNIRFTRNSPDLNKIVHITEPSQFKTLQSRQPFEFVCKRCGKLVKYINSDYKPSAISYWSQMLCGQCRRDLKRLEITGFATTTEVKENKHIPILVNNLEELKNIKNRQAFYYYCTNCGAKVEIPYGRWRPAYINSKQMFGKMLCGKCSSELTNSAVPKFGSKEYAKVFQEKYGVDNPMKVPEFKENNSKTKEVNHGDRNWNNPEKNKETFKQNHDGMTSSEYQRTGGYRNECIERNRKLYGQDWFFQTELFRSRLYEKFGEDTAGYGSKRYQNTMIESLKDSVDPNDLKNASLSQLISLMRIHYPEKYGIKKYYFDGEIFDSFPEMAFYIYNKDFGIPIKRNDTVCLSFLDSNGEVKGTVPDFIVNGRLVEIKGAHFFKPDGTMYCPFRNPEWSDERYAYECDVYERKHQCGLANGVIYLVDLDSYIQNCMNYVNIKYGYGFKQYYIKSDPKFIGKGYTPYTMDKSTEYQQPIGRPLTPFDIK